MSHLCIPQGGNVQQTWYVSGVQLNNAWARLLGYVHPGAGSPYVFDWNTSGAGLTVTGSTSSGAKIDAYITGSSTSGLTTPIGAWNLVVWHTSGTNTGSVIKFYDAGRFDVVPYAGGY
jgi:hypothetical protein